MVFPNMSKSKRYYFLKNYNFLLDLFPYISSYKNFCNIPDYMDGMVMYEYHKMSNRRAPPKMFPVHVFSVLVV